MSVEPLPAIQEQLGPGERLLWSGRPAQGLVFRQADAMMIPFSLMWSGFAFFWEYSVISAGKAPLFFMASGIPFVAIGIYMIGGRFFVDSKQRANTAYGVTNQRVIIVSGILNKQIKSLSLRTISDVSLSEKASGLGSILFGPSNSPLWLTGGAAWPACHQPHRR